MSWSVSILLLALSLAVLIGVALGLMGGGGSILTVPILVYVLHLPAHEAVATSLFVVGTTSLAAVVPHARAGRVRYRIGLVFGPASMVGSFAAGRVAHFVPATVLLLLFAAMMVVVAVAMMRKNSAATNEKADETTALEARQLPFLKIAAEGLLVGAFTGLVGAGGGFLVVPALVLLGGLSMREAVGTSLLVIAMNSFAGFAGHASTVPVDAKLIAAVTAAAILGTVVGARLVSKVPQKLLRRGFAWFVLVMAAFILAQEIPKALGSSLSLAESWPIVLGAVSLPLIGAVISMARALRSAAAARAAPSSPS